MQTRLLASCAVAAVLALNGHTASAQQPAPEQRPAAGEQNKASGKSGGDAATPRQSQSRDADRPAAGGTRGQGRPEPAQAQSPSDDKASGQGKASAQDKATQDKASGERRGQSGQSTRENTRPGGQDAQNTRQDRDRDRQQRSGRSGDRDDSRSAGERGRDNDANRRGAQTGSGDTDRSGTSTRSTSGERRDQRQESRQDGRQDQRQDRSGSAEAPDRRVSERFSATVERQNVRPLSRTDISVSIGATVPRSVRMYDVPRDVVVIYPQYRGHRFVVVDEEIVVIEPRSRRIVATLPRDGGGGGRAATSAPARQTTGVRESRLQLSDSQRQVIRTTIMREPRCRMETRVDFALFVPLPRTVEVCDFPAELVREVPAVERYRFVMRDNNIAIVDPDQYEVVDVIE